MGKPTIGVTVWLLLLGLLTLSSACMGVSSTSLFDAVRQDNNSAHQTPAQHDTTQNIILGLMNSACNRAQFEYLALESAYNNGLFLDSMCYQEFYLGAASLDDVNAFLTCENLALPVVFGATNAQNSYGHFDELSQKCNFCSDPSSTPNSLPASLTNPDFTRGIQTIWFVLDWTNKLLNVQGTGLRKAIESIIVRAVIGQVRSGALLALQNLVHTEITRGYIPSTMYGTKKRAAPATNATDPAFMYMNSSIEIQATFQMVALEPNFTYAQLQGDLEAVIRSDNFTSALAKINANVTAQSFSTSVPAATATSASGNAGASGTAAGGPAATTTGSAASASASGQKSAAERTVCGAGRVLGLVFVVLMAVVLL